MECEALVFADASNDFASIYSATDLMIPEIDGWAGIYPYLDRSAFRKFLAARDRKARSKSKGGGR